MQNSQFPPYWQQQQIHGNNPQQYYGFDYEQEDFRDDFYETDYAQSYIPNQSDMFGQMAPQFEARFPNMEGSSSNGVGGMYDPSMMYYQQSGLSQIPMEMEQGADYGFDPRACGCQGSMQDPPTDNGFHTMGGYPGMIEHPAMDGFPGMWQQPMMDGQQGMMGHQHMGGFPGMWQQPMMGGQQGMMAPQHMGGFPGTWQQPFMSGQPSMMGPQQGEFPGMWT